VPGSRRGSVVGLVLAGLQTAQGAGMVLAGLLAAVTTPLVAIAACGAAGSGGALALAVRWGSLRDTADIAEERRHHALT
jgi:hypothetical protein